MIHEIAPFRIDIGEADLRDLATRLAQTRWPESETVSDWSQGVPLAYLRDVCRYWATTYDWRPREARLNLFPQFRTEIDGLGIHFLHVRSPVENALPLVMTHGWPGSFVEFIDVIGPLTDPVAHGGTASDAFHVVCPSLPGYAFSDKPTSTGWGVERTANAWTQLMARLGYDRYGAQGGDWGSAVTSCIGTIDPSHVAGIHLNMLAAGPGRKPGEMTDAEHVGAGFTASSRGMGDRLLQRAVDPPPDDRHTRWLIRPSVSAPGSSRSSGAGRILMATLSAFLGADSLLDNVMLYWLTASGASCRAVSTGRAFASWRPTKVEIPTGVSIFPKEIFRPSRRWAERRYTNILHWRELERGGHFAALEQPLTFVEELRTFFRLVRT